MQMNGCMRRNGKSTQADKKEESGRIVWDGNMKSVLGKLVLFVIFAMAVFYLWTNYGPGKYKESHSMEETYAIVCEAVLSHKSRVSIVSDVGPIGDWQSLTEHAVALEPFKGSNLQAYHYTFITKDGKYYTNYRFTYGSGRIALFIADKKMDDMAEDLEGLSDYDKIKAVHDYLVLQCEYTGGFPSIYDALFNGKTICVGYAGTFFRVMNKLNIPVQYVCGEGHAWNLVQLDGDWYNMDVTWDDTGGDSVSYEYFLKTDKEFKHEAKGATARKSMEPVGKSAKENYELFRNHSAIYYYGPMLIAALLVLVGIGCVWSRIGT